MAPASSPPGCRPRTGGSAPILLHVWRNVGHSRATEDVAIVENTEWLAFAMKVPGLEP